MLEVSATGGEWLSLSGTAFMTAQVSSSGCGLAVHASFTQPIKNRSAQYEEQKFSNMWPRNMLKRASRTVIRKET